MKKQKAGATNNFKLTVLILLFFITVFHIFEATQFPFQEIVSDKILLAVALTLLGYLWIQEIRDRQRLQRNYNRLLDLQNRLKERNVEVIRSLILAEEAKDPYTKGHSLRVAEYAILIAKKLGFSAEELKVLENAGILHDIGKLGIADSILHKPGKLDDNEWEMVKEHPNMAVDILGPLEFLNREKKILKHHHERYDGKGYPDGIKGEQIPLGARILAVSDSFDAMRSTRSYRSPMPREKVIEQLKAGSGTQFDPKVVDAWLQVLDEQKEILWKS